MAPQQPQQTPLGNPGFEDQQPDMSNGDFMQGDMEMNQNKPIGDPSLENAPEGVTGTEFNPKELADPSEDPEERLQQDGGVDASILGNGDVSTDKIKQYLGQVLAQVKDDELLDYVEDKIKELRNNQQPDDTVDGNVTLSQNEVPEQTQQQQDNNQPLTLEEMFPDKLSKRKKPRDKKRKQKHSYRVKPTSSPTLKK